MNISSKYLLLVCLVFFAMTPFVLAKKTKLNLKLFDTPTDFSSEVSSASSIMGTRRRPDEPHPVTLKMVMPAPPCPAVPIRPVAISLTPNLAKVYSAVPVFEWKTPQCSKDNKCFVDISTGEITLVDHMPVEVNKYVFNGQLLPDTIYTFKVSSDCDSQPASLKLKFYAIDDKQKKRLAKQLTKIKTQDDYIEKVSELEFFYKNAIWFDMVSLLNELIMEDPEDQSLIEFKDKLYQTVQK